MRRNEYLYKKKCLTTKTLAAVAVFFLYSLMAVKGVAQTGGQTVDALVEMGFENVGWTEDADERVYVLQNSAYRLQGVGIGKATGRQTVSHHCDGQLRASDFSLLSSDQG